MYSLESLRCFCAVVDAGGFRQAAERLHRTQPAVSQQVQGLERASGHTLLERRGGRLTPAGQLVYERACRLLEDAENLQREVSDYDESAAVPLRVGASDTSAMYHLAPYLRRFSKRMPHVHLALQTKSSGAIEASVVRGELDLGIVTLPAAHADLITEPLFEHGLVLVVPENHTLAGRKRARLAALRTEPLLLLDETTRTGSALHGYFDSAGFEPQVALRSGSFEVIKRYIAEGLGIAILPEIVVQKDPSARLATVRIPGLPTIAIGAICRRHAYQSRAAVELLSLMKAPIRHQGAARPRS